MTTRVLRGASIHPGKVAELTVVDGVLHAGPPPTSPDDVVELDGRPVVPGLVDHHVHLLALAASWQSIDCSPDALRAGGGIDAVLRAARARQPDGWLRGVNYDVAASGPLDGVRLGGIGVGPARVQDRTGIQWVLDPVALAAVLPTDPAGWPAGVERDAAGRATGVLVRLDAWLRDRRPDDPPDLTAIGRWLAARGVTGLTDAGAANGPGELALLAAAGLDQRLTAMTRAVDVHPVPGVALGPVKVLLDDADLPSLDDLAARVGAAHRAGRAVAVHCVTDVQLVLALAAGLDRRDRVEHGSVVPDDLLPVLAAADPTVVVQPGLVCTRGDRYLAEVDAADQPGLHRLRSLIDAGLRVALSSDAPYGPPDPWVSIAAAADRRTASGALLGEAEAIPAVDALRRFTGPTADPGVPAALAPGAPADLVILDDAWDRIGHQPRVAATLIAGRVVAGALPT